MNKKEEEEEETKLEVAKATEELNKLNGIIQE